MSNLIDACIIARQEPVETIRSCEQLCDGIKWFRTPATFTDYSEQRNKSLEMSDAKFVLWIDSDESLCLDAPATEIRGILEKTEVEAFFVPVWSWLNDEQSECSVSSHHRIIKREKVRFKKRIGEVVHGFDPRKQGEMGYLHIEHMGYANHAVMLEKENARAELYRLQIQETPQDIHAWYEYAKSRACCDRYAEAITAGRRTLNLCARSGIAVENTPYMEMYYILSVCYIKLEDYDEAETWATEGKKIRSDYMDLDSVLSSIYAHKAEQADREHQLQSAKWQAELGLRPYEVITGGKPIDLSMRNVGLNQ